MLKGINKLLTGDLLKALCDMGHGDTLVIADANFPADTIATRLIRYPGIDGATLLNAMAEVFPLDTYVDEPAQVMDLTDGDKAAGMPLPVIWKAYTEILQSHYGNDTRLGLVERFDFYEKAKNAYLVIQTGEERQYGNLMLSKGVVK